jgi:hypothetical protein
MLAILLAGQVMSVQVSAPRLSPTEAVKVLQSSRSELDRTKVFTAGPEGPRAITMTASSWKPGSGYFPPQEFRPLGVLTVPGITYRLPYDRDHHREALEAIRREREQLRDTGETARIASEEARIAAETARTASHEARVATDAA